MVDQGATTLWELWNSDTSRSRMNSRNHFALGSVGRWFYEHLAGINYDPTEPGFKRIIFRPRPAGDLRWAEAEYVSMYGLISIRWEIEGDDISVEVEVPPNTTARVYVPTTSPGKVTEGSRKPPFARGVEFVGAEEGAAVFEVGAGRYHFEGPWRR